MGNSASIYPEPTQVDNKEWIRSRALDISGKSLEFVNKYVKMYHPFKGKAFLIPSPLRGNETVDYLAKYADAVTCAFFNAIGYRIYDCVAYEKYKIKFDELNETSVGNIAFTALNHESESIRRWFLGVIDEWRQYKLKSENRYVVNGVDIPVLDLDGILGR